MRKKIVAGNWKMNVNREAGLILASEVVNMVKDEVNSQVQVVLVPPFPHISALQRLCESSANVSVGAQNCSNELDGAFTGEVSASILKSFGVEYIIIGHSERRMYYHETSQLLASKVDKAITAGVTPIFCCGEPLEIREQGTHVEYVTTQLKEGLFHLSDENFAKLVIAYEPVWAIGTGKTASTEQAQEMHKALRDFLKQRFPGAENTSILYGGSCKASNAPEIFACADVDGGLIGGASLKSREFTDIAKSFKF